MTQLPRCAKAAVARERMVHRKKVSQSPVIDVLYMGRAGAAENKVGIDE